MGDRKLWSLLSRESALSGGKGNCSTLGVLNPWESTVHTCYQQMEQKGKASPFMSPPPAVWLCLSTGVFPSPRMCALKGPSSLESCSLVEWQQTNKNVQLTCKDQTAVILSLLSGS